MSKIRYPRIDAFHFTKRYIISGLVRAIFFFIFFHFLSIFIQFLHGGSLIGRPLDAYRATREIFASVSEIQI